MCRAAERGRGCRASVVSRWVVATPELGSLLCTRRLFDSVPLQQSVRPTAVALLAFHFTSALKDTVVVIVLLQQLLRPVWLVELAGWSCCHAVLEFSLLEQKFHGITIVVGLHNVSMSSTSCEESATWERIWRRRHQCVAPAERFTAAQEPRCGRGGHRCLRSKHGVAHPGVQKVPVGACRDLVAGRNL